MEHLASNPIFVVSVFILGSFVGYLVGRFSSPAQRQQKNLSEQLSKAKEEHAEFQDNVTLHFVKTADLVNNLTNSYKQVHDHLSTGAQSLSIGDPDQTALIGTTIGNTLESPEQEDEADEAEVIAERPQYHSDSEDEQPTEEVTESETESVATKAEAPQPKDYAPKSPEDPGTLSEGYGLDKNPA